MQGSFSQEQIALQEMAAQFSKDKLAPFAREWDEQEYFPKEVLKEAASLGMAAMVCDEALGGAGLSRLDAAIVFEQLARGCITTSAYLSIHNMVAGLINKHASDGLKQQWLPSLAAMDKFASYCLTEPDSGSDAASLKTSAIREGDAYIINGAKAFISGAGTSDVYVCMVRTGDNTHKGISCIIVEKDIPGISFGVLEQKMGWRAQPTAMVYFEDCKVPTANRIGDEGEGFKIALQALNGGRINIAACSLGGAQFCIEKTQTYLLERKQFGKKLAEMQALRFKLAKMWIKLKASQGIVYQAADALDRQSDDCIEKCAMAKYLATEHACKIADDAIQLHGGYGYLKDYQLERIYRDLRVHRILEGTNEIMLDVIARHIL